MIDPESKPSGPTRPALWLWLIFSTGALGAILYLLFTHGLPGGLAVAEFMAVPMFLLVWLIARSINRLINRDHP